jgi:hypothetical protein
MWGLRIVSVFKISDGLCEGRELASHGRFVKIIADADADTRKQSIVSFFNGSYGAAIFLRHSRGDRIERSGIDWTGVFDDSLSPGNFSGDQSLVCF